MIAEVSFTNQECLGKVDDMQMTSAGSRLEVVLRFAGTWKASSGGAGLRRAGAPQQQRHNYQRPRYHRELFRAGRALKDVTVLVEVHVAVRRGSFLPTEAPVCTLSHRMKLTETSRPHSTVVQESTITLNAPHSRRLRNHC